MFDVIAEMDEAQYNSICADTIDNFKNSMFDEQFDYCDDVELGDKKILVRKRIVMIVVFPVKLKAI